MTILDLLLLPCRPTLGDSKGPNYCNNSATFNVNLLRVRFSICHKNIITYDVIVNIARLNIARLQLLISLQCKYNKLQFGLRIGFMRESNKSYFVLVFQKTYSKEVHRKVSPFSRAKRFRGYPCRRRCYASFFSGISYNQA